MDLICTNIVWNSPMVKERNTYLVETHDGDGLLAPSYLPKGAMAETVVTYPSF